MSISEVKRKRKIIKLQELFPRKKIKFFSEETASVTFTVENMKIFQDIRALLFILEIENSTKVDSYVIRRSIKKNIFLVLNCF